MPNRLVLLATLFALGCGASSANSQEPDTPGTLSEFASRDEVLDSPAAARELRRRCDLIAVGRVLRTEPPPEHWSSFVMTYQTVHYAIESTLHGRAPSESAVVHNLLVQGADGMRTDGRVGIAPERVAPGRRVLLHLRLSHGLTDVADLAYFEAFDPARSATETDVERLRSALAPGVQARSGLPDVWLGDWSGELSIVTNGTEHRIATRLEIAPIDERRAWTWRLTYGRGDERQVRDYELLATDESSQFVLDERNGITLDAQLRGDVLVLPFDVAGNTLVTRHELREGALHMEIMTWRAESARPTGAQGEVRTHRVITVQRGALRRVR